jgi:hypothetical protein
MKVNEVIQFTDIYCTYGHRGLLRTFLTSIIKSEGRLLWSTFFVTVNLFELVNTLQQGSVLFTQFSPNHASSTTC